MLQIVPAVLFIICTALPRPCAEFVLHIEVVVVHCTELHAAVVYLILDAGITHIAVDDIVTVSAHVL